MKEAISGLEDSKTAQIASFLNSILCQHRCPSCCGRVWLFSSCRGKFFADYLGLDPYLGVKSEFWAALIMVVLGTLYTVTSGLYGVVYTDVFQAVLILLAILYMCIRSIVEVSIPEVVTTTVPLQNGTFAYMHMSRSRWESPIPQWKMNIPEDSTYSIYNQYGEKYLVHAHRFFLFFRLLYLERTNEFEIVP